jgi:hypothetical protein
MPFDRIFFLRYNAHNRTCCISCRRTFGSAEQKNVIDDDTRRLGPQRPPNEKSIPEIRIGDRTNDDSPRRSAVNENRVGEAIGTAMVSRLTLAGDECGNVALILDLCSAIVAARMLGNYLEAIKDAHAVGRRAYRYGSLRVSVRNAIIVKLKARIRRLANLHGNDVICIERVVGQREQLQLFVLKGFSNAKLAIGRANAVGGLAAAPQRDLRVEIGRPVKVRAAKKLSRT